MTVDACDTCRRPRSVCVCDRIVTYATKTRILVLQHPQEQDVLLGTAQLLAASVPSTRVAVGLSWRSLAHALGVEQAEARRWAVLFPDREARGNEVTSRKGAVLDPTGLEGVVVLDGTWSQAKTLYFRNPWLRKLPRMSLAPKEPSIYGRLRAEPRRECVSTLESAAASLTLCGEPEEIEAGLRRLLRTLVQRVRDADLPPEARRLAKRTSPRRARRGQRSRRA
jgi:DTW domain-containing protein YfiP